MLLIVLSALFAFGAAVATTEPAAIEAKRAEVARIQSELDAINTQVESAAEAYNGAQYKLGQVNDRIEENTALQKQTERDLVAQRKVLAERLRGLYATPDAEPRRGADHERQHHRGRRPDRAPRPRRRAGRRGRIRAARAQGDARQAQGPARRGPPDGAGAGRREGPREGQGRGPPGPAPGGARQREQRAEGPPEGRGGAPGRRGRRRRRPGPPARRRDRRRRLHAVHGRADRRAPAAAAVTPSAPLPSGSGNAQAAAIALRYLGVPYVWGGSSPSGFDCSGLASYAYAQIGKSVPHYTGAIWSAFPQVPSGQLQPGDLVFFHGLGHVGIYLGGDQFVHAPHTGDVVKVSQLSTYSGYVGAVRP